MSVTPALWFGYPGGMNASMHAISYQLYSSRHWPAEETFAMLAGAGLHEVEGFGPFIEDPRATRALLERHGLAMPSAHFALAMVEQDPGQIIATARVLGIEAVIVPYLAQDERPTDRIGWRTFARRLAAAGRPIIEAGFTFGWHNHDFEFVATKDGCLPIEEIAAASDEIKLELDLAWIHVAGQDPVFWLERYEGRVDLAHLKDVAPAGRNTEEDGWADLGHGVMDYARIAQALMATGVRRWVLEHDNPSDHVRFLSRSLATAVRY